MLSAQSTQQPHFSTLPSIKPQTPIVPLPPLQFYTQAQQPLIFHPSMINRSYSPSKQLVRIPSFGGQDGQQQINQIKNSQVNNLIKQMQRKDSKKLFINYSKQKNQRQQKIQTKQHKQLVFLKEKSTELQSSLQHYKHLYYTVKVQLQATVKKNEELIAQLQLLDQKNQKLQVYIENNVNKSRRISLGGSRHAPANVPILKINVPTVTKQHDYSVSNDSIGLIQQLRKASEEISQLKKVLQSEKQKFEYHEQQLNKTIERVANQRDQLRNEITELSEQNKQLSIELQVRQGRINSKQSIAIQKLNQQISQYMNEMQILRNQFYELKRQTKVKSQNLSKQNTDIETLKDIVRIKQQKIQQLEEKNRLLYQRANSYLIQNQINLEHNHKHYRTNVDEHRQQTVKKNNNQEHSHEFHIYSNNHQLSQSNKNVHTLEKHLQLSRNQMKYIQQATTNLFKGYMNKINMLIRQKQHLKRAKQSQDYELNRLYEIVKKKKQELQLCYQDNSKLKMQIRKMKNFETNQYILNNRNSEIK